VFSGKTNCQFGLQRAFNVQMQLCFWQPGDIRIQWKRPAMTLLNFISYALLDSHQALAMTADVSNCGGATVVFSRPEVYSTVPLEMR
jgi:hypothetical protein